MVLGVICPFFGSGGNVQRAYYWIYCILNCAHLFAVENTGAGQGSIHSNTVNSVNCEKQTSKLSETNEVGGRTA